MRCSALERRTVFILYVYIRQHVKLLFGALHLHDAISSCKRISYISVRRFSSLSRITSCRSDSSFGVKMEFSLRKPSSHSLFDLANKETKIYINHFK